MDRSPVQWALLPLRKYATFSGRAPRAEFWWFMLALMVIYLAMTFLLIGVIGNAAAAPEADAGMGALALFGGMGLVMLVFWLAILIPMIAVQVRRLHDTDRSGWWLGGFYLLYLLSAIVMFGSVGMAAMDPSQPSGMGGMGIAMILTIAYFVYGVVLLVFFIVPGTKGPNRFGTDPYGEDQAEVFR